MTKSSSRLIVAAIALIGAGCASMRGGSGQADGMLAASDWHLIELNGRAAAPADPARRPWIRFNTDSLRMSGSGGCNRASGPIAIDGPTLRFGAVLSTKMACADPALNSQEQDFFLALRSTDRYEIVRDTLALFRAAERLARMTRD